MTKDQQKEIENFILKKTKLALSKIYLGIEWDAVMQADFDRFNVQRLDLIAYVTSEEICNHGETHVFKRPTSWWQHFKKDLFPTFLLARFPVEYQTEKHTAKFFRTALYPQCPAKFRGADSIIHEWVEEYVE